jgi:hypothetical protein
MEYHSRTSDVCVRPPALLVTVGPFAVDLKPAEGLEWVRRARELELRQATVDEQVQRRRVHAANNSLTQGSSTSSRQR